MSHDQHFADNQANWNDRVPIHAGPDGYRLQRSYRPSSAGVPHDLLDEHKTLYWLALQHMVEETEATGCCRNTNEIGCRSCTR